MHRSGPPPERAAPATPVGRATVVGGGPAGLMAAEVLASAGAAVTVYEHMPSVGRKLLLAGRSGLNLTTDEPADSLLVRYGAAAPALRQALGAFTAAQLRAWSASLGQPTFVGSSGRVFPEAMRAAPLLRAWISRLGDLGVTFETRHRWLGWAGDAFAGSIGARSLFRRVDGTVVAIDSEATVLALGGASWPRVGSDGGWVPALRSSGVRVRELQAANCGVRVSWAGPFVERFAGTPLRNVRLGIAGHADRGGVTVTRAGLEGGAVYALGPLVREALTGPGTCLLDLDLHPDLTVDEVRARLGRARPKDSMSTALRRTLGLDPVARALVQSSLNGGERPDQAALAAIVKAVPVRVEDLMPLERAISSAGGICLDEIDDGFMLRKVPGVFVAGEMLDWEAPTGGYLLQATFSTAVAAANGACAWLRRPTAPAV